MHQKQILRFFEVSDLTGMARSTVYTRLDPKSDYYDPTFPKPFNIGPRLVFWDANQVQQWINKQIEERSKES